MKYKLLFLIVSLFFVIQGCEEEAMSDNMPSGKLISLKYPANYFSGTLHTFMMVHSMDGKLVAYKEMDITNENVFEADRLANGVSGRYIYTTLNIRDFGTYKSIYLYTYYGILPFAKDYSIVNQGISIVSSSLSFTNAPTYSGYLLSTSASSFSGTTLPASRTVYSYDGQPLGVFLRLTTPGGDIYYFAPSLSAGQPNTLNLSSGYLNSFNTHFIDINPGSLSPSTLEVSRYLNSDYTGGSYRIFRSSSPGVSTSVTLPVAIYASDIYRTYLSAGSSTKSSYQYYYGSQIPEYIEVLDGNLNLDINYPYISQDFSLNGKPDAIRISFYHPSSFRDANGFSVIWYIYSSPAYNKLSLPELPEEIWYLLQSYGINGLFTEQMTYRYVHCYETYQAKNFDDYMKNYFFGWGQPVEGWSDRTISFNMSVTKGSSYGSPDENEKPDDHSPEATEPGPLFLQK